MEKIRKRMYIYICVYVTESLCYTAEINILYFNNFFKKYGPLYEYSFSFMKI